MIPSNGFFMHPWVWAAITIGSLALCTLLPIRIQDENLRRKVNRIILIPASLVLLFYAYPVGLEMFRRLAIAW